MQSGEQSQVSPSGRDAAFPWKPVFFGDRPRSEKVGYELLRQESEGELEVPQTMERSGGDPDQSGEDGGPASYDSGTPAPSGDGRPGPHVGSDGDAELRRDSDLDGDAIIGTSGAPTGAQWWGPEAVATESLSAAMPIHFQISERPRVADANESLPDPASLNDHDSLAEGVVQENSAIADGQDRMSVADGGADRAIPGITEGGAETSVEDWPERSDIEWLRRLVRDIDVAVDVQRNTGTVIGLQITARFERMLERQPLGEDLLGTIRSVFQPPVVRVGSGFKEYEGLLGAFINPGSLIVLSGRSGSGRTITGLALLAHLRAATGVSASTLSYGGARSFSVSGLPQNERCGYLLELPADEDEFAVSSEFGRTLHAVQGFLRSTSSHLVVITTDEQWERVGQGAPVRPVEVVPAAARDIAAAWLHVWAPDLPVSRWVDHPDIVDLLERESPRGALEIVGLIAKAAQTDKDKLPKFEPAVKGMEPAIPLADGEEEFLRRVSSVIAARKSWRRQLLDWHRKQERTSFERNFLLAAATLREAPVGEVYAATCDLARLLEGEVPQAGQQGPGVIQLAEAIEADLSGDDDSLAFSRPGWDDAVLHYFWIDRPLSREVFLNWIAQAPLTTTKEVQKLSHGFSIADRSSRAARMASFALRWAARQRRPEYLDKIVTLWHGKDDLWPAAVDALTRACFDPIIGRETHNLLLNWARRSDPALLTAVAEVCAGDFGRGYPGKALVRLSHVAGSLDPEVTKAVRKAVQALWREKSLSIALLTEILKWCAAHDEARRVAGRRAFVVLAELQSDNDVAFPALIAPDVVSQTLPGRDPGAESSRWLAGVARGWRTILASPSARIEAAPAGRIWFDACLAHPEARSMIFYVFRQAVAEPGEDGSGLQHQLLDLLYDWQPADDNAADRVGLRHSLTDLLLHDGLRALVPLGPQAADEGRV